MRAGRWTSRSRPPHAFPPPSRRPRARDRVGSARCRRRERPAQRILRGRSARLERPERKAFPREWRRGRLELRTGEAPPVRRVRSDHAPGSGARGGPEPLAAGITAFGGRPRRVRPDQGARRVRRARRGHDQLHARHSRVAAQRDARVHNAASRHQPVPVVPRARPPGQDGSMSTTASSPSHQ